MGITFNVTVHYAVLVEDVDGYGDLLRIQPDDMLLQAQPGHLLQRALVTVLHEDVHFFLREEPGQLCVTRTLSEESGRWHRPHLVGIFCLMVCYTCRPDTELVSRQASLTPPQPCPPASCLGSHSRSGEEYLQITGDEDLQRSLPYNLRQGPTGLSLHVTKY